MAPTSSGSPAIGEGNEGAASKLLATSTSGVWSPSALDGGTSAFGVAAPSPGGNEARPADSASTDAGTDSSKVIGTNSGGSAIDMGTADGTETLAGSGVAEGAEAADDGATVADEPDDGWALGAAVVGAVDALSAGSEWKDQGFVESELANGLSDEMLVESELANGLSDEMLVESEFHDADPSGTLVESEPGPKYCVPSSYVAVTRGSPAP